MRRPGDLSALAEIPSDKPRSHVVEDRVKLQAALRQPCVEAFKESDRVGSLLEAHHKIVGISNDDVQ
jgi:hypothetical protein